MKNLLVNFLACLVLCVGCSSVKPEQKPPVAVVPADQEQIYITHMNFMARFVNGWLKESPPPDPCDVDLSDTVAILGALEGKALEGPPPYPPLVAVPSTSQSPIPTVPFGNP